MMRRFYVLLFCNLVCMGVWQTLEAQPDSSDVKFDELLRRGLNSLQTDAQLQSALDDCRIYIQQFANHQSDERKARVRKARIFKNEIRRKMGSSQIDLANSELLSDLENSPNDPDLNRELGLNYMTLDKPEEARIYLENAVHLNRNDLKAWRELVELNKKGGTTDQKIFAYKGYLNVDSSSANFWTNLGEEYIHLGKKTDAESSFVQALRWDPRQTTARLQLAILKEARRDWVAAKIEYEAILAYEKGNTVVEERFVIVQRHVHEQQTTEQTLQNSRIALGSKDPRRWELARTELYDLSEEKPDNQEAKILLRESRTKLYQYWYSEGLKAQKADSLGKSSDSLLARAADCFKVTVVYADSKEERDKAFERYKQTAIKLNRKIEARTAQEAAQLAKARGEFDEALRRLTKAIELDPELTTVIQPAITETERQITLRTLESRYKSAMNKNDWYSARAYLLELITNVPDSAQYHRDMETVNKAISSAERSLLIQALIQAFLWCVGGAMTIYMLWYFRKNLLTILSRFLQATIKVFKRLFNRNTLAVIVLLLFGYIIIKAYFWSILEAKLPWLINWLNNNQGVVTVIIFVIGAAWTIYRTCLRDNNSYNSHDDHETISAP